jgi:hypothetical protein
MKRLLFVPLAGALSFLTACSEDPTPARPKPAVDATAPARTVTATFALG